MHAFVKCYFLTVSIMASLIKLVVQAMRLDAVVSVSFIHESHSESISFLCPQHWAWTNGEQWKLLHVLVYQCKKYTRHFWEIRIQPIPKSPKC